MDILKVNVHVGQVQVNQYANPAEIFENKYEGLSKHSYIIYF